MSEDITGYDPEKGIYVVRDNYKLNGAGHLEGMKKGATQPKKVGELERANFTCVRSFEVGELIGLEFKKVFMEGTIGVKPDFDSALKEPHDEFVLYKGFDTWKDVFVNKGVLLPKVILKGTFLHSESGTDYKVGISNAIIIQPLKQNEYAFIATQASIKPVKGEGEKV